MKKENQSLSNLVVGNMDPVKEEGHPVAQDRAPQPPKTTRGLDSELQCMAKIDRLLADLEAGSKDISATYRVLSWINSRWQTRPCPEKTSE